MIPVVRNAGALRKLERGFERMAQVLQPYRALGGEENLVLIEDIAGHQSTTQNNETIYAFFQKHLRQPGSPKTEEIEMPANEEMQVTKTGQVVSTFSGQTVPSLSRREGEQFAARLAAEAYAGRLAPARLIEVAKRQSGYRMPSEANRPVLTGSVRREGYVIERYFVKGEGDYPIPYILAVPARPFDRTVLYLHPAGKSAGGGKGGEIEWLVRRGCRVLAPDLVGTGEVGPGDSAGGPAELRVAGVADEQVEHAVQAEHAAGLATALAVALRLGGRRPQVQAADVGRRGR